MRNDSSQGRCSDVCHVPGGDHAGSVGGHCSRRLDWPYSCCPPTRTWWIQRAHFERGRHSSDCGASAGGGPGWKGDGQYSTRARIHRSFIPVFQGCCASLPGSAGAARGVDVSADRTSAQRSALLAPQPSPAGKSPDDDKPPDGRRHCCDRSRPDWRRRGFSPEKFGHAGRGARSGRSCRGSKRPQRRQFRTASPKIRWARTRAWRRAGWHSCVSAIHSCRWRSCKR